LGGAKLWYNLAYICGTAESNFYHGIEKQLNVVVDDQYHLGFSCKYDMKEVTEADAQLVWTPKD